MLLKSNKQTNVIDQSDFDTCLWIFDQLKNVVNCLKGIYLKCCPINFNVVIGGYFFFLL